jgi:hypothetical protein
MKKIFFAIIILALVACERSVNTPTNAIENNWKFDFVQQYGRTGLLRTEYWGADEYMDFRSDGKLYSHVKAYSKPIDTAFYLIDNDTIKTHRGVYVSGVLKIERRYQILSSENNKLVIKNLNWYNSYLTNINSFYPIYNLKR